MPVSIVAAESTTTVDVLNTFVSHSGSSLGFEKKTHTIWKLTSSAEACTVSLHSSVTISVPVNKIKF